MREREADEDHFAFGAVGGDMRQVVPGGLRRRGDPDDAKTRNSHLASV